MYYRALLLENFYKSYKPQFRQLQLSFMDQYRELGGIEKNVDRCITSLNKSSISKKDIELVKRMVELEIIPMLRKSGHFDIAERLRKNVLMIKEGVVFEVGSIENGKGILEELIAVKREIQNRKANLKLTYGAISSVQESTVTRVVDKLKPYLKGVAVSVIITCGILLCVFMILSYKSKRKLVDIVKQYKWLLYISLPLSVVPVIIKIVSERKGFRESNVMVSSLRTN